MAIETSRGHTECVHALFCRACQGKQQSFQFLYVNVDRRAGTPRCWQLRYVMKNRERTIAAGADRRGASGCMIDERLKGVQGRY